MQRSRLLLLPLVVVGVGLNSASGCNCDDVLGKQAPEAVLVFQEQNAPPLDNLSIGLAASALGAPVTARFALENRGNVDLIVSDVVLGGHPQLCPQPSGGFVITEPASLAAAPRAFTVARGESQNITVTFTASSGQPACTVVDVKSNDDVHPSLLARIGGQGDAPQLCADKGVVDFGVVVVGDRKEDSVTLTSCGTRPVALEASTLNAQFPEPFEVLTPITTPQTLAVGDSVVVGVAFDPEVPGTFSTQTNNSGVIDVDTDLDELYRIELIGVAQLPPSCRIQVVPGLVQFGSVAEGRTSTQTVFVRNIGELDCTFVSADVVTGAPFSRTLVDLAANDTLGPQQGGSLTVAYAPLTAVGRQTDVLRVVTTDPLTPTIDVPLEGTSVVITPCFLEAQPTAVNFGNRTLRRGTEQVLILKNIGVETCQVREAVVDVGAPEFGLIQPPTTLPPLNQFLGAIVPEGEQLELIVNFRPEVAGPRAGNLHFEYKEQGFGNPNLTLDVPLSGNGVGSCIEVTPLDVDFGVLALNATADQIVSIRNCGGADLVLRGLTLRSGTHPDFHIQTAPALPLTVAPGASTPVTVRAAPTTEGQTQGGAQMYGVLDVLSDEQPRGVNLKANAFPACDHGLVCSPQAVDFGDVLVGEDLVRSIICNNPTTTPVTITPTVALPFTIVSAPPSIPAGGQGVIRVRFDAANTSPAQQTVNVGANDCSGAAIGIAVRGVGSDDELPACPQPTEFAPELSWDWHKTTATVDVDSHEVWVTPLVSRLEDTNADGSVTRADMPRVILISFDHSDVNVGFGSGSSSINDPIASNLRALDGATGREVWTVTDPALAVQSAATPAIVDLDGDGRVEILASKYVLLPGVETIPGGPAINGKFSRGSLLCFNFDGTLKWESEEWTRRAGDIEDGGGPAVGDVDGDGFAEIALGDHLFDHNGRLLWRGDGEKIGSSGHGPTSVLVDVDGQPGLELVSGPRVFRADGSILWSRDLEDGHPAVADLDGDGDNEVVIRGGELHVLNGQTGADLVDAFTPPTVPGMPFECDFQAQDADGESQCNIIPTNPAIVDFDGDGTREIITANHELVTGYHFNGTGLDEIFRSNQNEAPIFDGTGAAGPAGFDFEGNGSQEIVYSDENKMVAWSDAAGLIYRSDRASATIFEYSTIADVDLDGHADLLVASNSFLIPSDFGGVRVFHNQGTSWAQARAIWNQHAYVEDLVSELGTPLFNSTSTPVDGFRTTRSRCE
ncbi:MAG: choice-of-anchor D domain-containing protein [Deltaproteobacteria bacterium]|nr:choice-of-anchor D domain-containing protein [Deltaproteobacteria bacterium]